MAEEAPKLEAAARYGGGLGNTNHTPPEGWHLDKRVPLAIIAAIVVQSMSAIWWASAVDTKVNGHATEITRIEREAATRRAEDRGEVREFVREVRESLRRIEDRLGDKADRPRP